MKDGVFPEDLSVFDGVMITGSPASVLEPEPWMATLQDQICTAYQLHIPLFGACFGHQAIALALGGQVAVMKALVDARCDVNHELDVAKGTTFCITPHCENAMRVHAATWHHKNALVL